jgi:hypothetical protein
MIFPFALRVPGINDDDAITRDDGFKEETRRSSVVVTLDGPAVKYYGSY